MKVGDLVMFRRCVLEGKTGIVVSTQAQSREFSDRPHLALSWVAISDWGGQVQCFSATQLEVVSD